METLYDHLDQSGCCLLRETLCDLDIIWYSTGIKKNLFTVTNWTKSFSLGFEDEAGKRKVEAPCNTLEIVHIPIVSVS